MDDKIKAATEKSSKVLKEFKAELLDELEDLPEELQDIKSKLNATFAKITDQLEGTIKKASSSSEEVQLQAHLGLMEAKDKMESSSKVVDHYLAKKRDQTENILDEVELKSHLAKMEAEDFWEEKGPSLKGEFNKSKEAMIEQAEKAVDEIQNQFAKWRSKISN